jgi:hypothetical protein
MTFTLLLLDTEFCTVPDAVAPWYTASPAAHELGEVKKRLMTLSMALTAPAAPHVAVTGIVHAGCTFMVTSTERGWCGSWAWHEVLLLKHNHEPLLPPVKSSTLPGLAVVGDKIISPTTVLLLLACTGKLLFSTTAVATLTASVAEVQCITLRYFASEFFHLSAK